MIFYNLKKDLTECPPPDLPSAVALGIFDGVHIGHSALLSETVRIRDRLTESGERAVAMVWSFVEQPKNFLGDGHFAPVLTPADEKLRLFAEAGIDYAALENFSNVENFSPERFVRQVLVRDLHCRAGICGFNFRFGAGGKGNAEHLASLLGRFGAGTSIVPAVTVDGSIVSSSRIRLLIENGFTEEAAKMLGRPFSINFPVVYGNQLGRTIGIPTINQDFPEGHIIPKNGIYACRVDVGGDVFTGVTNVGCRPTVDGSGRINSETHILDYDGILYGQRIRVSFYRRLRDEIRFSSVVELKAQILKDISSAKSFFAQT